MNFAVDFKWIALIIHQINTMDSEQIRSILLQINLNFDLQTIDQVIMFLDDHIGAHPTDNFDYQVLAASAIVSELKKIPTVSLHGTTRTGILIENIMRHLGSRSKQQFLQVLTRQTLKWKETPIWLKSKIDHLKISYRIYKKYQCTFFALASRCRIPSCFQKDLSAVFWILFLFAKNESGYADNAVELGNILLMLMTSIFSEYLSDLKPAEVYAFFKREFPETGELNNDQFTQQLRIFSLKIQEIYELRHEDEEITMSALIDTQNPTLLTRFLDDISTQYDRFKMSLPQNTIDQITFLQLMKNVTPQVYRRQILKVEPITRKIDFLSDDIEGELQNSSSDDDIDQEKQENIPFISNFKPQSFKPVNSFDWRREMVSPIRPSSQMNQSTPLSKRQQNLSWVNNIIDRITEDSLTIFKNVYQWYLTESFADFKNQIFQRFEKVIKEFSPSCRDLNKRKTSLYHFYVHFILKIKQAHDEEANKAIFTSKESFDSILCLSVDLFNFAYQSLEGSYRHYCEIFNINLIEGHTPINWFGKNADLPKNIQTYLYNLEKKILIQEIWDDNTGFNLVCSKQNGRYHDLAILKRLGKHVDERTKQLCEKIQIQQREENRILNLVKHTMSHKYHLLRNNKIDQIIVCSIAACLSINYSNKKISLQQIFKFYNTLTYSFHSNKNGLTDHEGNKIDLLQFYNTIFLPEIEDIINDESSNVNILLTPIKLQRKRSQQMGIAMTPLFLKFQEHPQTGLFKGSQSSKKIKLEDESCENDELKRPNPLEIYRSNKVVTSLQRLDIDEKDEDEDAGEIQSPTFGHLRSNLNLSRTFSFGNIKP